MLKKILLLSTMLSVANVSFAMEDRRQNERQEIERLVAPLITETMDRDERSIIMEALSSINAADRTQEFINQVQQLITPTMNCYRRSKVMETLSRVNAADRATFIYQVQQLITPTMDWYKRSNVMKTLSHVNAADRATFVTQAQQLITPDMNSDERSQVIEAFIRANEAKPATLAPQAQQLITPTMAVDTRLYIINALSRDNEYGRTNRVARALLFMRNGNHGVWREVLNEPLYEIIILGGMAAVAQGANPYAARINVHAGDRDQATINAARTLNENWHPTPKDIDRVFNDFMRAVQQLEEPKKSLVLHSLGIAENGRVLPKPANENFAGLLHGVDGHGNFTLSTNGDRMQVNGREIVARFWHFANTYEEHGRSSASASAAETHDAPTSERAAMRDGIMNALAEGVIPSHNLLRCEIGRVQLLELATLQGRLRGTDGRVVDVDDLGLNPEISVAGADAAAAANAQPVAAAVVPHVAPRIRNLNEIAHYLRPFIDSLGPDIKTAEQFYMRLFNYRNNLAAGHVMARGERIDLDPSEVVYFVRMMEPITKRGKIVGYDINPKGSLVVQLGLDDVLQIWVAAFQVGDYMRQFGARDRAQLAEARRIEADRALREQQEREYAETERQDRIRFQQRDAAREIQRVVRGNAGRRQALELRAKVAQARAIEEQKRANEAAHPPIDQLRALRVQAFANKGLNESKNSGG